MKDPINRLVFFLGWLLSPLTFWNDPFVNIPVSYIAATVLFHFVNISFVTLLIVCYWLSNAAGLVMMYFTGKRILGEGKSLRREIVIFLATIVVYSIILTVLAKLNVIKPV